MWKCQPHPHPPSCRGWFTRAVACGRSGWACQVCPLTASQSNEIADGGVFTPDRTTALSGQVTREVIGKRFDRRAAQRDGHPAWDVAS